MQIHHLRPLQHVPRLPPMARPLRLHVPGGFYHVTLRGNHRLPIFFAEEDRNLLDEIAAEVTSRLGAHVHAYCWMTNHVHLVIQVSDVPLGRIVLHLASRYARTIQSRLETTGHLFERRYHGALIDVDRYLLAVVRYVHLNPVEAGIVADPADYRWSSHRDYIGRCARPWIKTGFVMNMLARDPADARNAYDGLMGTADSSTLVKGLAVDASAHRHVLGDDDFAARAARKSLRPPCRWSSLDEILTACSARFGCSAELLTAPSKASGLAAARAWVAHEAVAGGLATVCGIARRLRRNESAIRQLMMRYPRKDADR
jgi:REP element-mobilizing transposase RayT